MWTKVVNFAFSYRKKKSAAGYSMHCIKEYCNHTLHEHVYVRTTCTLIWKLMQTNEIKKLFITVKEICWCQFVPGLPVPVSYLHHSTRLGLITHNGNHTAASRTQYKCCVRSAGIPSWQNWHGQGKVVVQFLSSPHAAKIILYRVLGQQKIFSFYWPYQYNDL